MIDEARTIWSPQSDPLTGGALNSGRVDSLRALSQSLYSLCTATRVQSRYMAATYGLSNPQFAAFMAVVEGQPMTMGQIGSHSDLPTSSLTALVDHLTEQGLVSREAHPSDRRAIRVQLTADGRDLAEQVMADSLQTTADISDQLDDAELDHLNEGLDRLLAGYRRYSEQTQQATTRPVVRRVTRREPTED